MAITEVSATDRFTTPYAQSGIIFVTWKDGTSTQGSCAVVGRNDILTAGHVIYDPDRGGWADRFSFYFGADYNNQTDQFDSRNWVYSLESGSFGWSSWAWPESIYSDSNNSTMKSSESQYDVALIGVSVAIGDVTGWLGIDPNRDNTQTVRSTGYPNSGTGMMTDTFLVTRSSYWGIYESSRGIMGPGSSGGPLITSDNYLIGIKSGGDGNGDAWADIGFLWNQLAPKLAENDSLLGGAVDDYAASTATAGTLSVGGSTSGTIESVGDIDWFKVTLIAGKTYRFTLDKYSITGAIGDPFLRLYNSAGVLLSSDDDSGDLLNAELTFTASTSGSYYIAALQSTSSSALSPTSGAYKVSLAEVGGIPPGYTITPKTATVDEGNIASFTVTTMNVAAGTSLNYTLSGGISASDITGGLLTGTTTVATNGQATITVPIAADRTTEGDETLTVTVQGKTASTTIKDTSVSDPIFTISANVSSVSEGSSATFLLTTTNVAAGSFVAYTLSGISAADIVGGALSGNAVISSNGQATITVPIATDRTTEGNETLTVTVQGKTASTTIVDTSFNKGPADKDLVYVFKSEKIGAGVNPASYSYFYTVDANEANYIKGQASWPWIQKTATFEAAHSNPSSSVPVFRFWSDKHQSHFFTINSAEKDQIINWSKTGTNGYDWKFEGEGFRVYPDGSTTDGAGKSAIPVYRLWIDDKDFNAANGISGGHFFTADKGEYDSMIKLVGVEGEGIAFYGEPPGG
jgi:V8-like Glu-specific endopeptidase